MNTKQQLSAEIAAIRAGHAAGAVGATASTSAVASNDVHEVVVTAQRCAENLKDMPITIKR